MKIVLINLFVPYQGTIYTSGLVNVEPLGLEYIGAAAKAAGYDVLILSPHQSESMEAFTERAISEAPQVIGFGPATYNFNLAKTIAGMIKKRATESKIVFGGYHVTAVPGEVKDPAIDIAVLGEGEATFVEILNNIRDGKSYAHVGGISYFKDGNVVINPRKPRLQNLDELPYPLRTKEEMSTYKINGIFYPTMSEQHSVAQIAHSRGCPHTCSYCASGHMWERSVVYRDTEKVVDEIQYVIDTFGTNLIYFTDLTFNLHKSRVLELCNQIVKRNINVSWFCGCRTEGVDEELIAAMKAAGCSRIHYGIESIDEISLSKINRKLTFETFSKTLELTSNAGIIIKAYLMIGYPWETRSSLESIIPNLNKLYIDDLRLTFVTPLPGTEMFDQHFDEIKGLNWDNFTTDNPVLSVGDITNEELLEIRDQIFNEFYRSVEYKARTRAKISKFPYLEKSFSEFLAKIAT